MDNVTHSLFGYALGRALVRRDASRQRERAGIWSAVVGSNLPDIDFVVRLFAKDPQLTYLLEHRGHTHTLAIAVVAGLALGYGCARAFGVLEARERRDVALIGGLAGLLHIGFDALNNYGVHPFYPWDDRWYYGDAVFIVEPLLLALMLPLLALTGRTRAGRGLGFVLLAALLGLVWLAGVLAPLHAGITSALLLGGLTWQRYAAPSPATVLGAVTALLLVFFTAARLAQAEVRDALARGVPEERLLDLVANALPANPLCFQTIALTIDRDGRYRARRGSVALLPALIPIDGCRFDRGGQPTAPLAAARLDLGPAVRFEKAFEGDPRALRALADRNCDAAAMMRFVRAPFWLAERSPAVLGDLRYDRSPALEFAERELTGRCEDFVPPWRPPREDLLR